jgi:hypothetical protein
MISTPTKTRDRLAIALDTPNLDTAVSIAKAVQSNIASPKLASNSLALSAKMQFKPCTTLA